VKGDANVAEKENRKLEDRQQVSFEIDNQPGMKCCLQILCRSGCRGSKKSQSAVRKNYVLSLASQ